MLHSMHSTPARQRFSQSRAPSSVPSARRSTPQRIEIPDLPPYERPAAPLTADVQRKIAQLLTSGEYRDLQINLDHAVKTLTESAGELNERLTDARVRYERNKERRRQRDESEDHNDEDEGADGETDAADQERLGDFERKAEAVTDQMEQHMRTIIDSETRLRGIHDSVLKVNQQEQDAANTAVTATIVPRRLRGPQGRNRAPDYDSEDGGADEDPEDEDAEPSQEQVARERNAINPPSRRFKEAFQKEVEDWNAMSLTERYSANNHYIGFYRMVHDAKFPNGEAPPLPHSSTWFSHLEDSNAGSSGQRATRNRREPSPGSDDDIAIAREKVSLKCPITLQTFKDPVTSAKCRHTFERTAIENMIAGSHITHPSALGGRRVQAVRCPECSTINTKEDFRADPVILRRVKRAEELKARRAEDQLEGESQMESPNHVTLPSDGVDPDEMDVDVDMDDTPAPSARVKMEPRQGSSDNEAEESENDIDMDEEDVDSEEEEEDSD